ncbi:MAG: hypothetical protein R3E76_08995 [Planctomycetota bacterium]
MAEFAESLDLLWGVQKHDSQIVREQERIAKAVKAQAHEQAKVDETQAALKSQQEKLRQLKNEHKELEGELHRLDERVNQLDAQGTEAGSQAAAKQRIKIDELETAGLELLSLMSDQESAIELTRSELATRTNVLEGVAKTTKEVTEAAQAVINQHVAERTEAVKLVVPELLHVYDEVQHRHPGSALCHQNGEFCNACQGELRAQTQMQIKARAEIIRCPHCLRILDV